MKVENSFQYLNEVVNYLAKQDVKFITLYSNNNYDLVTVQDINPLGVLLGWPNYFVRNNATGKLEFANNDYDTTRDYVDKSGLEMGAAKQPGIEAIGPH